MQKAKIFIVDDDPEIIRALQIILESNDYEVHSAPAKEEGMAALATLKPDLIILDVMMDKMSDGFDFSRELKAHEEFAQIPVILHTGIDAITGVNFRSAFGETEMIKADSYLEKPVSPSILLSEVKRLLERKQ